SSLAGEEMHSRCTPHGDDREHSPPRLNPPAGLEAGSGKPSSRLSREATPDPPKQAWGAEHHSAEGLHRCLSVAQTKAATPGRWGGRSGIPIVGWGRPSGGEVAIFNEFLSVICLAHRAVHQE
ncbi:MAG: hypothetical protein QGM45_11725, partial [Anaerolineales bacterium]|nr:hypothetical protein [Anaerolineales bacterium]